MTDVASRDRQGARQRLARIPLGVLAGVLVLGAIVALGALRVGAYPFGSAAADDAQSCTMPAALPADAPSLDEHARFSATRTWIPLGLICTIDEPGDARAPQTTVHQSWTATWTVAGATALALTALIVILTRVGRSLRRGPGRASFGPGGGA